MNPPEQPVSTARAVLETLRGRSPVIVRPGTFAALCGALAWLAVLWFVVVPVKVVCDATASS